MPGGHPRNAKLTIRLVGHGHPSRTKDARLTAHHVADGCERFDAVSVLPDDVLGYEAVRAIQAKRYATPARTLARRREVAQKAREAAQAFGWLLTDDEKAMLAAFAPEGEAPAAA